jgi:Cu(I)/Ag(I) efflux system membrane fusion protein
MNTRLSLILTLVLALSVTACTERTETPASQEPPAQEQPVLAKATLVNGEQVIRITIGPTGYEPEALELQKGIPARLVFTRTTDNTCATEIHSPDLGVEKTPIPLNEPVEVTLTPQSSGTFTFACGMDMLKGTIVVTT